MKYSDMAQLHESDEFTAKEAKERDAHTEWHLLFAVEQDLALTPVGVGVEAEFPAMKEPPKMDVLLLRRTGDQWTAAQRARLPDGVRDSTAINNLLEFKYTESLTLQAITQGLTLLLLNELSDEPHNAFVKTFASRQVEKRKAFEALDTFNDLPANLVTYLHGLRAIWSLSKGIEMSERLTPERVMAVGEAWKKTLLASMAPEELDNYLPDYKQKLIEQGLERGVALAKRESVLAMVARNFDITIIADVTGLTVAQVNEIAQSPAPDV